MTTTTEPRIITTTPEQRQIAEALHFPEQFARHIDFDRVADRARSMGANFEVRFHADGTADLTLFWACSDSDGSQAEAGR